MVKWEKISLQQYGYSNENWEKTLNDLGRKGWELVCGDVQGYGRYVLKRRKI